MHYTAPLSNVSKELLDACNETVNDKQTRIVRENNGVYVVEYNENGPFSFKQEGWLPVKVICIEKYKAGGIMEDELSGKN